MYFFIIKPVVNCCSRMFINEATSCMQQFLHHQVPTRFVTNFTSVLHLPCRSYMSRTTDKREDLLREKDNIPEGYTLVYRTNFENYVYAAQFFSALSFVVAPFAFYYNVKTTGDLFGFYKLDSVRFSELSSYAMFGGFLLFNYWLQRVSYICPFRFYSKGDSHILVRSRLIPPMFRKTEFVSGDLRIRKTWLPAVLALHKLKNSKVVIVPDHFRTPQDMLTMMSGEDDFDN